MAVVPENALIVQSDNTVLLAETAKHDSDPCEKYPPQSRWHGP
jgi:hypothetical protein